MTQPGDSAHLDTEPVAGGRRRARAVVTVVFGVIVAGFLVFAVTSNWTAIRDDVSSLSIVDWATSFALGCVGIALTWASWSLVLGGLGGHLGAHDSRALFFTGQLGKYLPGSVWPALIQSELGRRHGIARSTMVASYAYALLLGLASGGLIGLFSLVQSTSGDATWPSIAAGVGAAIGLLVVVHPRGALTQALKIADKLGRPLAVVHPERRHVIGALALSVASWIALGAHAFVIALALGADAGDVTMVVGGFALAYVAGIVALPVPGGAGVREGILVVTIGAAAGRSEALTIALISRFILLAVDLVLALAAGAVPLIASVRSPSVDRDPA